jgi:hypothetical protein
MKKVIKYISYGAIYLASILPMACTSQTALLREDIAEDYRYFLFSDTDKNKIFDTVVIADTPEDIDNGVYREKIYGEEIVSKMYEELSEKRYAKITGKPFIRTIEETIQEAEIQDPDTLN